MVYEYVRSLHGIPERLLSFMLFLSFSGEGIV